MHHHLQLIVFSFPLLMKFSYDIWEFKFSKPFSWLLIWFWLNCISTWNITYTLSGLYNYNNIYEFQLTDCYTFLLCFWIISFLLKRAFIWGVFVFFFICYCYKAKNYHYFSIENFMQNLLFWNVHDLKR